MRRSIWMFAAGTAMVAMVATAQTPPPTTPPNPAPFNSGSALDGLMNRAWAKMAEMDEAYKRCDAQAYERALRELEQMREEARLAGQAATGAAGFSNVDPAAAKGLARTLREMVRQRGWQLHDLRKQCARQQPPQPPATATLAPGQAPAPPAPQPPNCAPPPTTQPPPEPARSVLDEIEDVERWEKEQERAKRQAAERAARQQTAPPAGMTATDGLRIAQQQQTIESFEAAIADLKSLLRQGRMAEARELIDDLDEWLDDLESPSAGGARVPQDLIDKWDDEIGDVLDAFPRGLPRIKIDPVPTTILDMHNKARAAVGALPLRWDPYLACQAASYGPQLAQGERLVHSPRTGRETSRENLLQALPGTSPATMINVWLAEAQDFIPGTFPNVSRTGNWADVGHYTQMLWPTTTSVGCGIQRGIGRFDWLICRYAPPGNRDGRPILPVRPAATDAYWKEFYRISDHMPVKAEFEATPRTTAATPPPENPNVRIIRCRTGSLPSPLGTYVYRTRPAPAVPPPPTPAPSGSSATPQAELPICPDESRWPTVKEKTAPDSLQPPPESIVDDVE